MRLNRLNARSVETIKRDGMHADGGGLYLRVRGTARSWAFVYQWEGRRREYGLGSLASVSLATAREDARKARESVKAGRDPIAERGVVRTIPTFGQLADEWVTGREGTVKSEKTVERWKRTLAADGYADALRSMKVDAITTDHVMKVLKPIWAKGPTATLARAQIESVLDAATVRKFRHGANPAAWRGHLEHLLTKPKKLTRGHHAALPFADVPAFMADLRTRKGLPVRALEFTILTAARSAEGREVVWGEIDFDAKVWNVPAGRMKEEKAHAVPLSDRALAILTELRPDEPDAAAFIFAKGDRPMSGMACPMLLKRMKVPATVHGFRSSFRDWAGDATEFPRDLIEAALAHSLGSVEAAYRRSTAIERRRVLMQAWADFCGAGTLGK